MVRRNFQFPLCRWRSKQNFEISEFRINRSLWLGVDTGIETKWKPKIRNSRIVSHPWFRHGSGMARCKSCMRQIALFSKRLECRVGSLSKDSFSNETCENSRAANLVHLEYSNWWIIKLESFLIRVEWFIWPARISLQSRQFLERSKCQTGTASSTYWQWLAMIK